MLFSIYVASAIIGWVLVGLMVVFGGDSGLDVDTDVDLDLDMDLDMDMDMDLDVDMDMDSPGVEFDGVFDSVGDVFLGMLSIRSMLFAAASFGAVGLLGTWLLGTSIVALPFAVGAGLVGSFANSILMKWLRGSDLDSQMEASDIAGALGKVVVPVGPGQKGRVAIQIGDRPIMMAARSFNERVGDRLVVGDAIVIVDTDEQGTALIARLDDLANE